MRKILVLLMLVCSIVASAQVLNFRTTSYTYKEKTYRGWTGWKPYQSSNMLLTINMDTDMVTVYSPKIQYYKIVSYEGTYIDNDGDQTVRFRFVDQDGDFGVMRLMQRISGKSEVYIEFSNVVWVYSVIRL